MNWKKIFKYPEIFFLFFLSFSTRFWQIWFPDRVVFDEAHFGLYATKYLSAQYYFDIHPPIGKMLFALFGRIGGVQPGFNFAVDSNYGEFNFVALRFLSAFLGSVLILLIYFFVKELGLNRKTSFFASFLVLFDNAILVQSRLILLDIILLFFIFFSLYLFFFLRKKKLFSKKWYLFHILCGISIGIAISIKWTGIGALGIIWLFQVLRGNFFSKTKKYIILRCIFLLALPLLVYFLGFVLHFFLLPNPCLENCGYVMEEAKSITLPPGFHPLNIPPEGNIFSKVFQDNKQMFLGSLGLRAAFYYQSDWYGWPFMVRPIQYTQKLQDSKVSYIYFLGNPAVWWMSFGGLLATIYLIFKSFFQRFPFKVSQNFCSKYIDVLFLGYFVYFFPFAAIERFMLPYHYLPALLFSIIIFAIFLDSIFSFVSEKKAWIIYISLMLVIFICFLYFAPLTYGIPLNENEFSARMWLPTWNYNPRD